MRLVKQTTLYFKEGNSDKVYEITLCDTGGERYVVNFRYGKRGAQLKEGTKTAIPVALAEAEKIYDALVTEKMNKGYSATEGGPVTPKATMAAVKLEETPIDAAASFSHLPASREKAILRRLHSIVTGAPSGQARNWAASRVIWKAGEYRISEGIPYLIQLYNSGNPMQQYCCAWALARSKQPAAIPALQTIYQHGSTLPSKMAGAGLLLLLEGADKQQHLQSYIQALPEAFKPLVSPEQAKQLQALLHERIAQKQTDYKWATLLYLVSTEQQWLKPLVKNLLQSIALKPSWFKQVRSVYKLAELLNDFELLGMLSCRVEREKEMFAHYLTAKQAAKHDVYVADAGEWIVPGKEFKKADSRIAYSSRTRWYLHRRTLRRLDMLGNTGNADYVKLATAILISYNRASDFQLYHSTYDYTWRNGRYERVETRHPSNAQAIYLHQILSGDHPAIELTTSHKWKMSDKVPAPLTPKNTSGNQPGAGSGGILKKLVNLFGNKKPASDATVPPEAVIEQAVVPNPNGTPFLHLWNAMPQAYIQLLMQAQMDEVHQFAIENLDVHPQRDAIKARLDVQACRQLVFSRFAQPAAFGLSVVIEKYSNTIPDAAIIAALLNSVNEAARDKGMEWANAYKSVLLSDAESILDLLLAPDEKVSNWGKTFLQTAIIDEKVKQVVAGKLVAYMASLPEEGTEAKAISQQTLDNCFALLSQELGGVAVAVVADLLQHKAAVTVLFGLRLLQTPQLAAQPDTLPDTFIHELLTHTHIAVREEALRLLDGMSNEGLLQKQELLLLACLSTLPEVRTKAHAIAGRLAAADAAFGNKAAGMLLPYLLRKETSEGMHMALSHVLCNQLSGFLQQVDKTTALNLLYSNYAPAQTLGAVILEKYTDPEQLTILQIVALGSHENLAVREWCWRLYQQHVPRMRYEKESSIKLLESKWDDTRAFAMQYFKEQFRAEDWSAEALIALADSVKPAIEAYGRELITRFFTLEDGETYLLKLSQHPSEKMQLFATNYLERFAADDLNKIQALSFYFRSVLTRVNKSRVAKNRIYRFLQAEGRKNEEAAKLVATLLSDISATAAIGDKAKCIEILLQLTSLYAISSPLLVKETAMRQAI